jgi:hypothetical protein
MGSEYEKAVTVERVLEARFWQQLRQRLGNTPRERLTWLLDEFVYADLPALTPAPKRPLTREQDADRYRLWLSLRVFMDDGGHWSVKSPSWQRTEIVTARDHDSKTRRLPKSLQILLAAFGAGGTAPEAEFGITVGRPRLPLDGIRKGRQAVREALESLVAGRMYSQRFEEVPLLLARLGPRPFPAPPTPRRQHVLSWSERVALPDALVMAMLALLEHVPAPLLRSCPYRPQPQVSSACGRVFVAVKRQKWCLQHGPVVRRKQLSAAQAKFRKGRAIRRRRRNGTGKRRGGDHSGL